MSWKLLDRPKTMKVTKNLARQYTEMDSCPHDRPLSERRLQVYQKLLAAGQFRPVTWASALCTETGGLYRVNGKHTSTLLSGLPEMPEFFVVIEEYECDTLEDVAKLYATFDSSMQSRTANDIYASFAGTVKELKDLPIKVIRSAITGMAYHHFGQDLYGKTQPQERAEMLLDCPEFGVWLYRLLEQGLTEAEGGFLRGGHKGGHILRQPVVASVFASWQKSKQAALEFWREVINETNPKPESPSRKLARYLQVTSLKSRGGEKIKMAGTREVYVKCLHSWNAWRKNEPTNLRYQADKPVPEAK